MTYNILSHVGIKHHTIALTNAACPQETGRRCYPRQRQLLAAKQLQIAKHGKSNDRNVSEYFQLYIFGIAVIS